MSLLSENVLRAADAVIVPLIPSPMSVRMLGLARGLHHQASVDGSGAAALLFDGRPTRQLHQDAIVEARERFPQLLATEVPYWSEIERMTARRAPLPAFSPRSPAALLYAQLWAEVDERLQLARR